MSSATFILPLLTPLSKITSDHADGVCLAAEPVEVQHLPLSLLIARGSHSPSASWLLDNPYKYCMFSNYGPVYSKALNNILQRFSGN